MAADDMIERLWEASQSGDTIRREWLEELVWHRDGKERLRELGRTADEPTLNALMDLLHDYADASRRNASKRRRGKEWWRVLAIYLREEGPETWKAMFSGLPDADMHEEGLELGTFTFNRRIGESKSGVKGPLVSCTFDDGRKPDEISWSTFETYLKEKKSR